MSANPHRSEFTIAANGKDYVIRPTLELVAQFEEKFGMLIGCIKNKKTNELYAMLGMLLENAQDPCPADQGAQLAFENGFAGIDMHIETFVRCALRLPMPAEEEGKKKPAAKKAGKPKA